MNNISPTRIEQTLLEEIRRRPHDMTAWLIYADWLEERGDPRAGEIREQCQWRLPLGENDVAWLGDIAAAHEQASAGDVRVAIDMQKAPPLGISQPQLLAADLQNLDAAAIARDFPRDDAGKLETSACVLLTPYASDIGLGGVGTSERSAWLVAEPIANALDKIVIKIADRVAGENPYNWSKARWLWDRRAASADLQTRWGFPPARLSKATFFDRADRLLAFERSLAAGQLAEFDRQTLCVLLLDEARFADALALFGIRISPSLNAVLTALPSRKGPPISTHFQPSWIPFLRRELWRMAPWRMSQLMRRETLLARTRSVDVAPKRLAPLPDQPYAAKLSLLLGAEETIEGKLPLPDHAERFRLFLETTNSTERLVEHEWTRPIDFDIARTYGDHTR